MYTDSKITIFRFLKFEEVLDLEVVRSFKNPNLSILQITKLLNTIKNWIQRSLASLMKDKVLPPLLDLLLSHRVSFKL